jgi:hypothetical protein
VVNPSDPQHGNVEQAALSDAHATAQAAEAQVVLAAMLAIHHG